LASFWDNSGEYNITVYSNTKTNIKKILLNAYSKKKNKFSEVKAKIKDFFDREKVTNPFLLQNLGVIKSNLLFYLDLTSIIDGKICVNKNKDVDAKLTSIKINRSLVDMEFFNASVINGANDDIL
jgi:hypothetical protein